MSGTHKSLSGIQIIVCHTNHCLAYKSLSGTRIIVWHTNHCLACKSYMVYIVYMVSFCVDLYRCCLNYCEIFANILIFVWFIRSKTPKVNKQKRITKRPTTGTWSIDSLIHWCQAIMCMPDNDLYVRQGFVYQTMICMPDNDLYARQWFVCLTLFIGGFY